MRALGAARRWPAARRLAEPSQDAPGRPAGIAGVRLPGPFPVGTYAARAARAAARVRARAAVRRGVGTSAEPREGLLRAARRARRGAVLDVAQRTRDALELGTDVWPTARRSSSPAAATTTRAARTASPNVLLRGVRAAASPARATCSPSSTGCASSSPPRACSSRRSSCARAAVPRSIGVVTGEGGKARDDVLAGLRRRGWAGTARVGVRPGPGPARRARDHPRAAATWRRAGEVDAIVVARGGGSLADLFAFCDETLCRTVALLRVPVIASVGHHTDRTLIDDVAAVSCSTPTHAAEEAVPEHCARRAPACATRPRRAPGPRAPRGDRARPRAGRAVPRAERARRAPPRPGAPAGSRAAGVDAPAPGGGPASWPPRTCW